MIISDAAIRNRVTVLVLIVGIVIVGAISYRTLPREAAPDVPIPFVTVLTVYQGVSPGDMETSVTMKIEKELTGLKGLKEITSYSAESVSTIVIEFTPEIAVEDALQYVRDRVDLAKADLPDDADEPIIKEFNIAERPVMYVNLSGDLSPARMKAIADDMQDKIEAVGEVLDVEMSGALEREIRIEIDADLVAAYGLTISDILSLIPREHLNVSAGGLETEGTKFNVRVPAEFRDPAELDSLVLLTRDGRPIYLTDVARVNDTFKDRASYSRLDGRPTITLGVKKRIGANIVSMSDKVKAVLAQEQPNLPAGVKLDVTFDMSKYIRAMVKDLENNIISGLILVLGVLMLFMGLRTSVVVSLAIPLSMLMSFVIIQALGYTLNMIVLFSLVLSLGMLVDNAIVIVENIYRHMQLGYDRVEAAMKGTAEVAWPVISSTATTVAAFLPLAFWPGIVGDFMKYLPVTVIITLSSSLFVALVISPTVCSVIGGGRAVRRKPGRPGLFLRAYRKVLSASIEYGFVTVGLAVMLLVGLAAAYRAWGYGVEFFPDTDPDRAVINIRFPQGTNIRETDRLARILEGRVEEVRPELEHVVSTVGSSGGDMFFGGGTAGPQVGDVTLVFRDYEVRERPSADAVALLRGRLSDLAGAEIKVEKEKHGPPTGDAVTIRITGKDFSRLVEISEEIRDKIAGVPGLVNLRSDFEAARPEMVFNVDRRRARLLGVDPAGIGMFLRTAIYGTEVGKYREFNDEYDITVRLPLRQRTGIDDLLRMQVPNAQGQPVALSSLGEFTYHGGLGTITRINQERVVSLTGDAEGRLGPDVLKDVQERIAGLNHPGYQIQFAGEKQEQEEAKAFLSKALIIALLSILLILVMEFNALSVPLIIMTTIILSLAGVLAGLLTCRMPFGIIMTGIGVISLAGVVVNNAILLLDYTGQLRRRGMDLVEAAVTAGQTRLRPVLLTAVTTVLGLVPMALGVSFDFHDMTWATRSSSSQFWKGMAVAVIFGLTFATVLTLVVVPTLYVMFNRLIMALGRLWARLFGRSPSAEAAALGAGDAPGLDEV